MKTKIAVAVAALFLASGTAYAAAVAMGCCDDCCAEMRAHADHAPVPAPAPAPAPRH